MTDEAEAALEPWEREWLDEIRRMAADPARHVALCCRYCHEGLKATRRWEDAGRHFVEFGICSHREVAEVPRPRGVADGAAELARDACAADPAALARLVAHILARGEVGELGC